MLFLFLLISAGRSVQAQSPEMFCQTILPSPPEVDSLVARHVAFQNQYNPGGPIPLLAGLRIIPVQFHIVTLDNGMGGIMEADLLTELAVVNTHFQAAGLVFVACDAANVINSTELSDIVGDDESDAMAMTYNIPNVVNIYLVNSAEDDFMNAACGWAYYSSSVFTTGNDYALVVNSCATNSSTMSHELGHYFDLFHTHETSFGAELVNGMNCMTAGDKMCSTPADPNLSGLVDAMCNYTGMGVDANGDMYTPSTINLMSYSTKACRTTFTAEQLAKITYTANTTRAYISPINCPENDTISLDASCELVVPDYRPMITANASCTYVDTTQIPAPGTVLSGVGTTMITITVIDANMDIWPAAPLSCIAVMIHRPC